MTGEWSGNLSSKLVAAVLAAVIVKVSRVVPKSMLADFDDLNMNDSETVAIELILGSALPGARA